MGIQESGENYLETILILRERNGSVRSIDLAREMEYSKPSVSRAVNILKDKNYINIDEKGYLSLTEEGQKLAESLYERHKLLSECFIALGVDVKTAREDACKIEHVISEKCFEKIKEHYNKNREDQI